MSRKVIILFLVVMLVSGLGLVHVYKETERVKAEEYYKRAYANIFLSPVEGDGYDMLFDTLLSDPILNEYFGLTSVKGISHYTDYETYKAYYSETLPKELQPIYDNITKIKNEEIRFKIRQLERAVKLGNIPKEELVDLNYNSFLETAKDFEYGINRTREKCLNLRWVECYYYGLKAIYEDIQLIEYYHTLYIEMKGDKERQVEYKKRIQDDFNKTIEEWNQLYEKYENKQKFEDMQETLQEVSVTDDIGVYLQLQVELGELKFEIRRIDMNKERKSIDYDRMINDLLQKVEDDLGYYQKLIPENCVPDDYYGLISCEYPLSDDHFGQSLVSKYNEVKQGYWFITEYNQTRSVEELLRFSVILEAHLNVKKKILKNTSIDLNYATIEDINVSACVDVKNLELGELYVNKLVETDYKYEQTRNYYENIFYTYLRNYQFIHFFYEDIHLSEEDLESYGGIAHVVPFVCLTITERVEELKLMMEHDIEKYYIEER